MVSFHYGQISPDSSDIIYNYSGVFDKPKIVNDK